MTLGIQERPLEVPASREGGRVLEVTGATRRFGTVSALEGVALAVERGEIVALLGPSGCGKTTLLRCVAGLETLDRGTIAIRGRDVSRLEPDRRGVAMVFQDGGLFPHLTVRENVAVGAASRGTRWRDALRAARVETVLRTVRLDGLESRYPHQLSGGQRQRVGIARALAADPDLMLMDEPFANLDADLRLDLRRELRRLHQAGTVAETVFVTHDQTEALGIADRIAVMFEGRLAQEGTPAELLARPATLGVARFLGVPRINVLAGPGETLAVRPSDLTTAPSEEVLAARGTAVAAEPFAGGWLVTLTLAAGCELEYVDGARQPPPLGAAVLVHVDPVRVHCFESGSGRRLELAPRDLRSRWASQLGAAAGSRP